jgi:tetratricopeptide (TPR) repeat protein
MRPKEFYEQLNIQEDKRYIFTLTPPEFEGLYKKFVKKPIEEFKFDGGKVTCESHFDFKAGVDRLDETLKSIQKACVIIANITEFKPDVMFELGVALMKKGRVIPIAETSFGNASDLPFNISKLGVEFYELDNLDVFSRKLVNLVKRIIPYDHISLGPRTGVLMGKALRQRRERDYEMAFVLFREMDNIEPKNWYIYKEWAITHEYNNNYEEAISMLNQALELATTDRQKAEIHTALGVVYRKSKMEGEALASFQQAENLYSDDAELYDKWAFLFHMMRNYQEAMNKMMRALKIDPNNKEFIWKLEYYTKRFSDRDFRKSLKEWLDEKRAEERRRGKKPERIGNTTYTSSPGDRSLSRNNPKDYERFIKQYSVQEVLTGTIAKIDNRLGIFVQLEFNIIGLIHAGKKGGLPMNFDVNDRFEVGKKIRAKYLYFDNEKKQIGLTVVDS